MFFIKQSARLFQSSIHLRIIMDLAPFPSPTLTWHTNTYQSISPTRPELSAKGKTVVVTGGGTGIGAETARYFAEAGASRIALLGRREQPLLDTKASIEHKFTGIEVFVASTDVTKKSEVDAAFAKFASYSIAKLAIFRLWDSLAFANPEISVFHLQPGVVDTAMNKEAGGVDAVGFQDDGKWNGALRSGLS
jgi:NAD(P)-dependent dehydrogenase (short-subunit alcohol dehydrogenase family)